MSYKKNSPRKNGQFEKYVNYSDIENDPYVKKWIERVNSKKARISILMKFCNFIDKTPEELILEHHEDILREPLKKTDIAKKQLHSYFGYLTGTEEELWKNTLIDKKLPVDDRVSWNSAIEYMHSKLSSFYNRNRVRIDWQEGDIPEHRNGVNEKMWKIGTERIPHSDRKGFIIQMRDGLKLVRDRAILLCMVSSSMDGVDLFKLKVKDFNNGYRKERNFCYLHGIRYKMRRKGIIFQTFFNSEACDLIRLYLKTRPDKTIKKFEDAWLFISNRKRNGEYTQLKNQFADNLKDVCVKLNINNVTPKSIRRWFKTELTENNVKIEFRKRMMGHALEVGGTYYESTFEDIEEGTGFDDKYVEEIEQYTLLGNGGRKLGKVDKRVEKLEDQNKLLIEQLAETNKRNEKLENEFGNLVSEFRIIKEAINKGILIEDFGGIDDFSPNDKPIQPIMPKIIESKDGKKLVKDFIDKAIDKE